MDERERRQDEVREESSPEESREVTERVEDLEVSEFESDGVTGGRTGITQGDGG